MGKRQTAGRAAYGEALRAIGWYFDQQRYRGIFVAEVDDGFVGKARMAEDVDEAHAEGFSFPRTDVSALMVSAAVGGGVPDSRPPQCPDGYGPFMHAVGKMYDRNAARCVTLLEVANGFVIGFTTARDGKAVRRRLLLDRAGIEELMDRADA